MKKVAHLFILVFMYIRILLQYVFSIYLPTYFLTHFFSYIFTHSLIRQWLPIAFNEGMAAYFCSLIYPIVYLFIFFFSLFLYLSTSLISFYIVCDILHLFINWLANLLFTASCIYIFIHVFINELVYFSIHL